MPEIDPKEPDKLLESIRRRLAGLTVAVILMAMMLIITAAAVFGSLVNYFYGDAALYGSSLVGAALLGFGAGWMARRRA